MPIYNRGQIASKSIESVINQSYTNWELIIVDDGSTEGVEELKEWVKKDKRIRLIQNTHEGVSVARNIGMEEATGEYIAFLDSDDLFKSHKIEKQLAFMVENNYVFCHTAYDRINEEGIYTETMYSGRFSGNVFKTLLHGCPIATPTVMIKRSAIKDKRFIKGYTVSQDICFWIDMAYENELGYMDQPLSMVTYTEKSTAVNDMKILQGQKNIVAHVLNTPEYVPYRPFMARREKIIAEYAERNKEQQKKNIIIDIPFNIDLSVYMPDSKYIYPKLKASFLKTQTPEWIERRIALFMKYTAQSLIHQTNQDFRALIRCTEETLPIIEEELKKYPPLPAYINFTFETDVIIEREVNEKKQLYRVIVDSDNMYSDLFIQKIHEARVKPETQTLICQDGYIYDEKTNRLVYLHHNSPSFYVAIYNEETYKTLYAKRLFENHWRAVDYPYEVIEGNHFCICVHEQNVDNDFEKIIKWFKGLEIEGQEKEDLLKEWHIMA